MSGGNRHLDFSRVRVPFAFGKNWFGEDPPKSSLQTKNGGAARSKGRLAEVPSTEEWKQGSLGFVGAVSQPLPVPPQMAKVNAPLCSLRSRDKS